MRFTFTGPAEQVYPQYIDLDTGSTLVAEPGKTYDIAAAEGVQFWRRTGEVDEAGKPVHEQHDGLPPYGPWKPAKPSAAQAKPADASKEN